MVEGESTGKSSPSDWIRSLLYNGDMGLESTCDLGMDLEDETDLSGDEPANEHDLVDGLLRGEPSLSLCL